TWTRLLDGHTGITSLKHLGPKHSALPCQVAALVPRGPKADGAWMPNEWLSPGVRDILCFEIPYMINVHHNVCLLPMLQDLIQYGIEFELEFEKLMGRCVRGCFYTGGAENGDFYAVCGGCRRGSGGRRGVESAE